MDNSVRGYYDLEEKERLALTDQEFEAYIVYECMKEGVIIPTPAQLKEVPEEPTVNQATYFKVIGDQYTDLVAFSDEVEARTFMNFKSVCKLDWDYNTGSKYLHARPFNALSMAIVQASSDEEFELVKSALKKRTGIINENEKETTRYTEESRKYDRITSDMRNDRNDVSRKQKDYLRVMETFANYLKMVKGDVLVATIFLEKVFDKETINDAAKWLGEDWAPPQPQWEVLVAAMEVNQGDNAQT